MVELFDSLEKETVDNFKGGKGKCTLIKVNDKPSNINVYAKIIVHPHSSIGRHEHINDAEIIYCLEGCGKVYDNGTYKLLKPGMVNVCLKGPHELINDSDEDLVIIANVVKEN